MTNAVFYSVCPYGTGTIETGDGTITITSGVATLSVAQSGNLGAGVCIEYNSLECWIAPNRIAFTSGGTTELLTGTKIEGGTSGATGIVRAIEVTSGTWAGGDAAGWIYFESTTGTWGSSEQINRTKPTSSTNIATTNGSLEGNIGNGNTEFVVKNATGGAAANQTATSVTSVHHEWASLSDYDTYFIDSSHINDTDLTNADVVAYACCYYDHANPTTNPDDNAVVIAFGTTGADNYLQVYTPIGGAESINTQRHTGVWSNTKYRIEISGSVLQTNEEFNRFVGLQMMAIASAATQTTLWVGNQLSDNLHIVDSCICQGSNAGEYSALRGIRAYDDDINIIIKNSIFYGFKGASYCAGIDIDKGTSSHIYNTIAFDCERGLKDDISGTSTNCISFNNVNDVFAASGTPVLSYCTGDDADFSTGTGNIQWTGGATDWANVFTDYSASPPDVSLKDFSGTGAIIEQGTSLLTEGVWRDIIGTERDTTTPDIGVFEYVSAGPSISIPVIMHHYMQQRIS